MEALSEALSTWGDEVGAIVVISHDKSFCDEIEFSHVATVVDGAMVIEERNARESDWTVGGMNGEAVVLAGGETPATVAVVAPKKELDPKLRKLAYNAPKRIAKLEQLIGKNEDKIAAIGEEMLLHGDDVGKLCDLNKEKEKLASEIASHMKEWEDLEELLAQLA